MVVPRKTAGPVTSLVVAAVLLCLLVLSAASQAEAALEATDVRVQGHDAKVRVIVEFQGAPPLTGLERQVDALDRAVADGRAVVRVNATGITTSAAPASGAGVTARVAQRPGNIVVLLDAPVNRFKFVSYRASVSRNVLVIDLWRATTRRAATILDDGCLSLTGWRGGRGAARARGLELLPLFESNLVLSLRAAGAGDTTIALRPVTATGGTFLPDFSGFATPGRWRGTLPYTVSSPRRAMLEAWSASAKDGSLDCLVQVPVVIRP
jgi:hypothetical protein